ncbi:MAG: helix-turn-helix domain-containing protein [Bdellovibrionia bacterium]
MESTKRALDTVSRNLGSNVSILRKKRGLSQHALAQLAGLPRSTLAYVESGAGNPSLANLTKLAGALQTSLEELLAPPPTNFKLVRASEVPTQIRQQGRATVYKLLPDPTPGMLLDRFEMEAGARMGGVPHHSGTKEYLTCIQGEIIATVAGNRFHLKRGDVLAFPGDRAHSYENPGSNKNICVSVVALAPV